MLLQAEGACRTGDTITLYLQVGVRYESQAAAYRGTMTILIPNWCSTPTFTRTENLLLLSPSSAMFMEIANRLHYITYHRTGLVQLYGGESILVITPLGRQMILKFVLNWLTLCRVPKERHSGTLGIDHFHLIYTFLFSLSWGTSKVYIEWKVKIH